MNFCVNNQFIIKPNKIRIQRVLKRANSNVGITEEDYFHVQCINRGFFKEVFFSNRKIHRIKLRLIMPRSYQSQTNKSNNICRNQCFLLPSFCMVYCLNNSRFYFHSEFSLIFNTKRPLATIQEKRRTKKRESKTKGRTHTQKKLFKT